MTAPDGLGTADAVGTGVREEDLFQIGILDLATGLVNAVDGSGSPEPVDDLDATAAYLEKRLRGWRAPSTSLSRARDAAAHCYVEASLAEYYARRGA